MARSLLWFLLAGPLAIQTWGYLTETLFYGEFIHWTGDWSARLLIVALAATPLRLTFPTAAWSRWLLLHRRDFGIATFLYAAAHTLVYLARKYDVARVLAEAAEPAMWTGWVALIIMLPLALTSNNISVRALGLRWKRLHRAVYFAALLTFLHWVLSAFDPRSGYIHAGVLAILLALRWWQVGRRKRRAVQ